MSNSDQITPKKIRDTLNGFMQSRILLSAIELDIFSIIGDQQFTAGDIAQSLNTDARATDRLLNALVSMGFMKKDKTFFSNRPDIDKFLNRASRDFISGLGHTVNKWESWSTLTEAVKQGTSLFNLNQKVKRKGWSRSFIDAMHYRGNQNAEHLVNILDIKGINKILDVGGGSGVYAIALCKKNKKITATVLDLPEIIPFTREYINKSGMGDRINTIESNYLNDDFPSGYDLIIMSAIIHINGRSDNIKLIKKGAGALTPGGKLLIQDFFIEEDRISPLQTVFFALNMLVATRDGDTYTEQEVRGWMLNAGLTGIRRIDYGSRNNLLIGTRKNKIAS